MFISVQEMQLGRVRFRETFPPGQIEFYDTQLRQASPLEAEGMAELMASLLEIRIKGRLAVRIEAECDRCLEPAEFPVDTEFELFYRPAGSVPDEEMEIGEADREVGFYQGNGLDLTDVLREQILLALPMQRLCRPDCQGICPVCGGNRNLAPCGCQARPADDRWAKLKGL